MRSPLIIIDHWKYDFFFNNHCIKNSISSTITNKIQVHEIFCTKELEKELANYVPVWQIYVSQITSFKFKMSLNRSLTYHTEKACLGLSYFIIIINFVSKGWRRWGIEAPRVLAWCCSWWLIMPTGSDLSKSCSFG